MIQNFSWRNKETIRPWYNNAFSLIKNFPNDLKVLDLGSGLGEFAQILKTKFDDITCCDGEKDYVEKLRKKGLETYKFDFNKKFPLKGNSFNLVIALEVIEHLTEPVNFINETKRILLEKGYLLISTPNIAWFGYRFFSLIGKPPYKTGYHLQFYNFHTFKKILRDNSFELIKSSSITPFPLIGRLILKLTGKPIWITVNKWQNLVAQDLIFLAQKK